MESMGDVQGLPGQDATRPDFDSKVSQLAPVQLGRAFLLDSVCRRLQKATFSILKTVNVIKLARLLLGRRLNLGFMQRGVAPSLVASSSSLHDCIHQILATSC